MFSTTLLAISVCALVIFFFFMLVVFRRVVPTNEVHIVQSAKNKSSFGGTDKDGNENKNGNKYYAWPTSLPVIGVSTIVMPLSVFDIVLESYDAYDQGRLPFRVDVMAFFRIDNSNVAAERVYSFDELKVQLLSIVQGSIRSILASHPIEEIMQGRSKFGEMFTSEIEANIASWGVTSVKSIELMDIRDAEGSNVIANIMNKKISQIDMESRVEVANNNQKAEIAEIEARQITGVRREQSEEAVGIRKAEKEQNVGIATEKSQQLVKEQELVTTQKAVAVKKASDVGSAEIARDVQVVDAEAEKKVKVAISEGDLEAKKNEAQGIKVEGEAKANAKSLDLLAPIDAQIKLAEKIGENKGYQAYLLSTEGIKAVQVIGVAQAEALAKGDLKVLVNSGEVKSGVNSLADIFTGKGGANLTGMLENLANGDVGKAVLGRLGINFDNDLTGKPSVAEANVTKGADDNATKQHTKKD